MLIVVCEICKKTLRTNLTPGPHFCDQHLGYADGYIQRRTKLLNEGNALLESRIEKFRNEFLREIAADVRKLEIVK